MAAISIGALRKTYDRGRVLAVADVSFDVGDGELFGLIGPDGAGKTTVFRILATLLTADSGTASILGHDVVADYRTIRTMIGYMPGRFSLYQDLTVEENLHFFATIFGTTVRENEHLIHDIYVQLEPFRHRRAGDLSGGMKQKLALCCALVHRPRLLLLDEPTTGVDPVSRKEFWNMLAHLKRQGITMLVSTPYMDEAIRCERIALMQQGRVMTVDRPQAIIEAFPTTLYAVHSDHLYHSKRVLMAAHVVDHCHAFGDHLHCTLLPGTTPTTIVDLLERSGRTDIRVDVVQPTIEDCFIDLMRS